MAYCVYSTYNRNFVSARDNMQNKKCSTTVYVPSALIERFESRKRILLSAQYVLFQIFLFNRSS